jgi:protein TonB
VQEAVSQILIDRAREAEGISRMVAVSVLAHAVMIAILILAPTGWLSPMPETDVTPMMITLGGAPGPDAGGTRMLSGRSVQAVAEPTAKPRVDTPPAAAKPEMVAPSPTAKPAPRTPAKPVERPADKSSSRSPTTGAEVKTGSSRVDTGAAPVPFGGLSTGGGGGDGATTDYANFCCPAYLRQVTDLIKRNWQRSQGAAGSVQMKFVINRDGSITGIEVEKPSGQALLDQAALRALVQTNRLPQLPREFPENRLTIHLIFDYQR